MHAHLTSTTNRHSRWPAVLAVLATFGAAMVWSPGLGVAGFYPGRPVYDYEKYVPHDDDCNDLSNPAVDHGRCGPTDGPVFNSFVNVPHYGDERGFFDAYRTDEAQAGSAHDPLYRVTEGSREVELRVFIDNDANAYAGYKTIARETRLQVELPHVVGRDLRAVALISAPNATPQTVEDTGDLIGTRPFRVEYVPGSAVLYHGTDRHPHPVDDAIVSGGALISNKEVSGVFVAGFSRDAVVNLRLRIIPVVAASRTWRWIIATTVLLVLVAFALWPTTRRRVVKTAHDWWGWSKRYGFGIQILSNVVAAGLIALLAWLVAQLF
jgi:hypothetical protein